MCFYAFYALEPNSMEALSELSKTEISTTVDLKQVVQQIVETPDESFSIPYINRGTLITDKNHNLNPNISYFQGVTIFNKTKMIGSLNTDTHPRFFLYSNGAVSLAKRTAVMPGWFCQLSLILFILPLVKDVKEVRKWGYLAVTGIMLMMLIANLTAFMLMGGEHRFFQLSLVNRFTLYCLRRIFRAC